MTNDKREIRRKLRVLQCVKGLGCVAKSYRYFCAPKLTYYCLREAYLKHGEQGLTSKKPIAGAQFN